METLKNLFFLRHAETDANLKGFVCGRKCNLPINNKGFGQILELKKSLSSLKFDNVYVSTMLRTKQTYNHLKDYLPHEKVFFERDIEEWDVGDWDYKNYHEVPNPLKTNINPPNGETLEEFSLRIINFIEKIPHSKTNLIISHGAVLSVIIRHFKLDHIEYAKNAELIQLL